MRLLLTEGKSRVSSFFHDEQPAKDRLNQLLGELPKLEAEVAYLKVNDVSGEEVLYEAKDLYDHWPKLTNDEKRKIAEAIFGKDCLWQRRN